MDSINDRLTPSGIIEGKFRCEIRNALDLDIFTRDDQIVEEVRRLKNVEKQFIDASTEVADWKLAREAERSRLDRLVFALEVIAKNETTMPQQMALAALGLGRRA